MERAVLVYTNWPSIVEAEQARPPNSIMPGAGPGMTYVQISQQRS